MNNVHAMAHAAGVKETSNRARNDELYPLVIAGDENAKREMIEGNMALVTLRVESFIANFPRASFLRDDLISEGLLALTTAVNSMWNPAEPNPTGYILVSVSNAIGALVDSELNMQVSGRAARNARAAGESIPAQLPMGKGVFEIAYDESAVRQLRDTIESCAENDIERTIIRMREEGHVDKEIADAIEMPVSTTYMIRRDLYQRFLTKTGLAGEA